MVIQTLGGKDNSGEVKKIHVYIAVVALIVIVAGISLLFIPGKPACGNGVCGPEENCFDCPQDCKCMKGEYCSPEEKTCVKLTSSVCGNSVCESDENCSNCPQDCGPCSSTSVCGNSVCESDENCSNCPQDCGPCSSTSVCGNSVCESDENCSNCPQDCGPCSSTSVCGNSVCESDENCFDCLRDCGCEEGEYCSPEEKTCVKPTCGNGKCESYEDPYTCCLDCFCSIPGEICNEETKKCEKQEIAISDERAIELAVEYFETQGLEIKSTESLGVSSYDGKLIKKIKVQISGEVWFRYVGVTEDEEVIDLPAL